MGQVKQEGCNTLVMSAELAAEVAEAAAAENAATITFKFIEDMVSQGSIIYSISIKRLAEMCPISM